MSEKHHKLNIYELAEATGFSSSTVSKALNNTGRISEKTRQLILAKAAELNYIPSYHAKALSSKKSFIIAVIFSDNLFSGLSHPHFSVILEYFKREVEQQGYEVTFVNRKMGNTTMSYLEFCRYRNVDGVFIVNYYSLSVQIPELIASGIPIVTADAGDFDVTTITSNDVQGGRKAAEYLISLGHRKLAHIAGPLYTQSAQKRLDGFLQVMKEHHITDYVLLEAYNFGYEDGYNSALELLQRDSLPTAIFVASDWMALGAIKAFTENGLHVPKDISVIGYDNLEFLQYSSPALTTVAQNKDQIGTTAAKYLIDAIAGQPHDSIEIDVEIVERDTCKPIE